MGKTLSHLRFHRTSNKSHKKQTTPEGRTINEINHVNNLIKNIRRKKMIVSIYRAPPNKSFGADRSFYLYRWEMPDSPWVQGQKFLGDNHQERCDAAIAKIRAVCNEIIDAEMTAMNNEGMK